MRYLHFYGLFLTTLFLLSCKDGSDSLKLIPVSTNDEYGYIDWEGKTVINPQFSEARLFSDGTALVKSSGDEAMYGYIDTKGSYIINPQYLYATDFQDGIAFVVKEGEAPKTINKKGEVLFDVKNAHIVAELREGLAAFSVEDEEGELLIGFLNKKGEEVIAPEFLKTHYFSEGRCAVLGKNKKWGYIDKKGKTIIGNRFFSAQKFLNGKAVVRDSTRKAGVIDTDGKYIIEPQFQRIIPDGKRFIVSDNGKYGWVDGKGKYIINPQFDEVFPFGNNNIAPVKKGNKWGYIDTEGNYIIDPKFDTAFPFTGKKAFAGNRKDGVGIIDKEGDYVFSPRLEQISPAYISGLLPYENPIMFVKTDHPDALNTISAIDKEWITLATDKDFKWVKWEEAPKIIRRATRKAYGNGILFDRIKQNIEGYGQGGCEVKVALTDLNGNGIYGIAISSAGRDCCSSMGRGCSYTFIEDGGVLINDLGIDHEVRPGANSVISSSGRRFYFKQNSNLDQKTKNQLTKLFKYQ